MQIVEKDGDGWDLTVERRETREGDATVTVEVEDLPISTLAPQLAGAGGGAVFPLRRDAAGAHGAKQDGSFIGIARRPLHRRGRASR